MSDGSDCKAQGILPGDIVTAVNGTPVTTTDEVTDVIKELTVGDTMVLTIWRSDKNGGSTFDVTVKLVDVTEVYK